MEHPDYYDPDAARRPAPQLTKAELRMMTPEQVVAADEAGQFTVIKSQRRDPVDAERRGERWATRDEAQEALQAEARDLARIKDEQRVQARREGVDI